MIRARRQRHAEHAERGNGEEGDFESQKHATVAP
jgi:hypothetical protein